MMTDEMRIHAQYDFMTRCIQVYLLQRRGDQMYTLETSVKAVPEGRSAPAAFLLDTKQAQQLMDQLWQCGLRPTECTGSAGALAAVEKHLADMRTIAMHGLGITP